MYLSDFLRGIFILLIPLIFFKFNSMPLIYFLVFLSFCAGRFFIPTKMTIIPSLVSKDDLFLANSLVSTTAMIAAVLGLGLGGIIVAKWGLRAAFSLDAATFLLSALFIFFIRIKEEGRFRPHDIFALGRDAFIKVKNSFLVEIKEGFVYILRSKETRYAAKVMFVLFAAIGSLYTVFIVFMQEVLSTVTSELGWIAVGIGGGLFVGSLLYGRIGSKFPVRGVINLSLIFSSLFLIFFVSVLKYQPYKLFAFFSCFFLGAIVSPIVIAVNTLIHKESENDFWGRIFSSLEVVIHLALIIFMFTASYLAEAMTPFTIIVGVGIILFLFGFLTLFKKK